MDLSCEYLGLKFDHPLMPGASPFCEDMDVVRRLEDAGAPALVLSSLFEEQLRREAMATAEAIDGPKDQFAEALTYLPEPDEFSVGPDEYLARLSRVKTAVSIPVIGSLNGTTPGGWLDYGKLIEQAGADALEINLYHVPADAYRSGEQIEKEHVDIVRKLKHELTIPLAVKLSPFYTSLPHFAHQLDDAGADAVIIFNRFYQADIDIEELDLQRSLRLSDSSELLLRLRWVAILFGNINADLAVTGGVHAATDAIKAVMTGASAVQMVSAIFRKGPEVLRTMREEMAAWLEENEYQSLSQARGSMSLQRCPDPDAYTRANYLHILQNWRDSVAAL